MSVIKFLKIKTVAESTSKCKIIAVLSDTRAWNLRVLYCRLSVVLSPREKTVRLLIWGSLAQVCQFKCFHRNSGRLRM